jgi:hypothetical protein
MKIGHHEERKKNEKRTIKKENNSYFDLFLFLSFAMAI